LTNSLPFTEYRYCTMKTALLALTLLVSSVEAAPCDTNTTLCKSLDLNSYCGKSVDPLAICTDGSGCSCNWGWQYNATRTGHGHCRPLCNSHCAYDVGTPCMQENDGTCLPKGGGVCPAGTFDCSANKTLAA
jgi:hypothetical protein